MMDTKLRKEAFVQGHSGTSVLEIVCLGATPPLMLFIIQLFWSSKKSKKKYFETVVEFVLLIVPQAVQLMGPLSPTAVLGFLLACVAVLAALRLQTLKKESGKIPLLATRQALSAHRGGVMLITCMSILAVDFPAFPRRFAKAETFGTGLMDAGVGSIVAASSFAIGVKGASEPRFNTRSAEPRSFRRDVFRLAALLALGFGRLVALSALGYQNPAGEYGAHWNFFVTLAALRCLTLFVPRSAAGSPLVSGMLGFGVLIAHQSLLSWGGIAKFIHSSSRGPDLVSANKEGIFSLPGYFALHLLGCAVGAAFEEAAGPTSGRKSGQARLAGTGLVAALWAAFVCVSRWVQPVSRRACNASYVLWTLSINAQSLAFLAAVTAALPTQQLPQLLQALSDAMLPAFLVANILTGAVNLSIDTLATGDWMARGIVVVYMGLVGISALIAQRLFGPGDGQATSRRRRR